MQSLYRKGAIILCFWKKNVVVQSNLLLPLHLRCRSSFWLLSKLKDSMKVSVGDLWHCIKSLTDILTLFILWYIIWRRNKAGKLQSCLRFSLFGITPFGSCQKTNKKHLCCLRCCGEIFFFCLLPAWCKKTQEAQNGAATVYWATDWQTHRSLCCLCVPLMFGWVTDNVLLPLGETETNTAPPAWKKTNTKSKRKLSDGGHNDQRQKASTVSQSRRISLMSVGAAAKTAAYQT